MQIKSLCEKINARVYYTFTRLITRVRFKWNKVETNGKVEILGAVKVSNSGIIRIEDGVHLNSSWSANKAGGGQIQLSLVTSKHGEITIGKNSGISNSTIYSACKITIEDNVMIGVNNVITDTDHHSIYFQDRINGNVNIMSKPILIKNGAWIGGHCIILKGVTIGENAVVAAGSVVTRDIPDNEIWGGNPIKFLKRIEE